MSATDAEIQLRALIEQHTANVFRTMVGLEVRALETSVAVPSPQDDVVMAFIGLTGAWTGSGCISCTGAVARSWSARLLMMESETVDADVLDAVGELANMIIGNVKEGLAGACGPLQISTPTVIHGSGLHSRSPTGQTQASALFDSEGQPFEVRVSLTPSRDEHRAAAHRELETAR